MGLQWQKQCQTALQPQVVSVLCSSGTRHHCDPAVSFLITGSQKVPACVHPTRLVKLEGSLRETVHPLLSFQRRNQARDGPSPFCVCVYLHVCMK